MKSPRQNIVNVVAVLWRLKGKNMKSIYKLKNEEIEQIIQEIKEERMTAPIIGKKFFDVCIKIIEKHLKD